MIGEFLGRFEANVAALHEYRQSWLRNSRCVRNLNQRLSRLADFGPENIRHLFAHTGE